MRYDVPAIKSRHPGIEVRIHTIQKPGPGDVVEFTSARQAYEEFCQRFGPDATKVYPDERAFMAEFNACVKRDAAEGTDMTAPVADSKASAERELAVLCMAKITGVDKALAETLFQAGFSSIEDVASSSLDQLEVVDGITPSTSDEILASARGLLAAT
jgi:hypothetical protein